MKRLDHFNDASKRVRELRADKLSRFDRQALDAAINDIHVFLQEFLVLDAALTSLSAVAENKDTVINAQKCLDSIDALLPELIGTVEAKLESDPELESTVGRLEPLCETLLEAKRYSLAYRETLPVAVRYMELDRVVLGSISDEISNCFKDLRTLQEMLHTSPVKKLMPLDVSEITGKIKNSTEIKSCMPTFSSLDERLLGLYHQLESKLEPIQASILIVPQALEYYSDVAIAKHSKSLMKLIAKYEDLVHHLHELRAGVKGMSRDLIDRRWEHIFLTLMKEAERRLEELEDEIELKGQLGGSSLRGLESIGESVDILKRAVGEKLLTEDHMIRRKDAVDYKYIKIQELHFKSQRQNVPETNMEPARSRGSLFDALQLKPVMIEYNPTSAKKKSPLEFEILEDDESEVSFRTESSKSLLNRLMGELEDKENESADKSEQDLVLNMDQMTINEHSPKASKRLSQSDPFITPNAKLYKTSSQKPAEKSTKLLKYVPLPVPDPNNKDHRPKRTLEFAQASITQIPLPISQKSRISLLTSTIRGTSYTKPQLGHGSKIPRSTLVKRVELTPQKPPQRPYTALDTRRSPTMLVEPTPLRVIKQRARATSSLGTAQARRVASYDNDRI
ncbi:hypothetical protein OGAPHI_005623 [Ogataea philodendri]|uniref:Karyogamy protein n=1 Tax=Ogataea philodendri TaxID=1378263 RepID=A0A9P8T1B9_9ASCO|nr:uncharacterized protein OGAPHI_005623 [Ogataea philodendri]KAH3662371.1 hypothetical protein OGAPHI_005623 [Ogataea philodendri]